VWNVEEGTLQHVIAFGYYFLRVSMSQTGPDNRAILAVCEYDKIHTWEVYTGRLLKSLDVFSKAVVHESDTSSEAST
jgi:hypothetical protein